MPGTAIPCPSAAFGRCPGAQILPAGVLFCPATSLLHPRERHGPAEQQMHWLEDPETPAAFGEPPSELPSDVVSEGTAISTVFHSVPESSPLLCPAVDYLLRVSLLEPPTITTTTSLLPSGSLRATRFPPYQHQSHIDNL